MKKNFDTKINLLLLLISIIFVGCKSPCINLLVTRPAEINLGNYKQIAVDNFFDNMGSSSGHALDLSDEIFNSLGASNRFKVLDRQQIDKLLREKGLVNSQTTDEDKSPKLFKIIGASAYVFGRIQFEKYNEKQFESKPWQSNSDKRWYYSKSREGTYTLRVNIKVIDVETTRSLTSRTISAERLATKSVSLSYPSSNVPDEIDQDALYRECLKDIVNQFMKMVAPYHEWVEACFEKDGDLPEVSDAKEKFLKNDWTSGMQLLFDCITKKGLEKEVRSKAYYNLALMQVYCQYFLEADENLKVAKWLDPNNENISELYTKLYYEQAVKKKLDEQNASQ